MLIEALTGKAATSGSPLHSIAVEDLFKKVQKSTKAKAAKKPKTKVAKTEPQKLEESVAPSESHPLSDKFTSMFSRPTEPNLVDATPFREFDVDVIREELQKMGLDGCGDEIMYSGITGEPLQTFIFFGPVFYQKLKHMVVDKMHCATKDHEVLTTSGWKTSDTLSLDDKVATLTHDGCLVYEHPTKILRYPNFKGKMYHIADNLVDLQVTMEHRMWVATREGEMWNSYNLVTADNLFGQSAMYQKNAVWNAPDSPHPIDPWEVVNNDTFPDWVWTLSAEQCRSLINSLGFGHRITMNGQLWTFYTISSRQADEFMRLCLHAGWSTDKKKMWDGRWGLEINRIDYTNRPYYNHDTIIPPIFTEEIVDYEGEVFCIQVPSEVFYIRRNGKAVWTGNSRARGPKSAIFRQPLAGRGLNGGLRIGGMERDCLAGNGAPYFLKDRLMEQSDAYRMWKCDICGLPVVVQKGKLTGECKICGLNRVSKIKIPYGTKLIMQELMAMNIVPRIFTTPHGEVRVKPLDDAGRDEIAKLRAEAIKESKK